MCHFTDNFEQPLTRSAEFAFKVLETITDAGYTLAPVAPTERMLAVAAAMANLDAEQATALYRAMLAAA